MPVTGEELLMECNVTPNKDTCPCQNTKCERRGVCCECLRAHLGARGLPACIRALDWVAVTPVAESAG